MSRSRPYLQTLIFEITQRCNHNCIYCYNVWHADAEGQPSCYPKGELDTKGTLTLLNKALDETTCNHVTLTGGEPLLRSDLKQILNLLAERDVRSTLISNGRLLTETAIVDLVEHGVVLFELPLLSHNRETHDFFIRCIRSFGRRTCSDDPYPLQSWKIYISICSDQTQLIGFVQFNQNSFFVWCKWFDAQSLQCRRTRS